MTAPIYFTSGHLYMTPLRPIVPTRENSLRGPKFEWAAQLQWSVPSFSRAAAGMSQFPYWDIPLGHPMHLGHPSSVTSRCQTKADFLLYSAQIGICVCDLESSWLPLSSGNTGMCIRYE